jgi:hypothetical protein
MGKYQQEGDNQMRILIIAGLCAILGGCWTAGQDVATSSRYGEQFVGKDVDAVVARQR